MQKDLTSHSSNVSVSAALLIVKEINDIKTNEICLTYISIFPSSSLKSAQLFANY